MKKLEDLFDRLIYGRFGFVYMFVAVVLGMTTAIVVLSVVLDTVLF